MFFKKILWGKINKASPITPHTEDPAKCTSSILLRSCTWHIKLHLPSKQHPQSYPVVLLKLWVVISFDCAASMCHDKRSALSREYTLFSDQHQPWFPIHPLPHTHFRTNISKHLTGDISSLPFTESECSVRRWC